MRSLTVSIVTYQVNKQLFSKVLEGLGKAVRDAKGKSLLSQTKLVVVDNGNDVSYLREEIAGQEDFEGRVIDNPDNVGFGRAHNQALLECDSDMHLVLNPDAVMYPDGLSEGLAYLAEHEETVMISPYAENSDGSKAYLCKRYPSVVDLFMRGFLPASLQEAASERLASRQMYKQLIDRRAASIIMIDLAWCGGLSEARKIANMAEASELPVTLHDCTGPIVYAASCALSATLPNASYQEAVRAYFSGWYTEIVDNLPLVVDGRIAPLEGAGLGLGLRPELFERSDATKRMTQL